MGALEEGIVYALDWQQSAWAQQFRDRTGFAVQVFPIDTPRDPARHLLAAARLAEELGLDGFFVGDHPAWALDPFVHLAAIAATTQRIRLGVNVCCALYRHPVMTARLAADVDNLSDGRLTLGLGNGWDGNEFANLGLPFPPARERQQALEEAITIMRGVWGEDPFSFEGQHFQCTGARVSPAPMQRPSLPIMVAGGGERVTLRQVARYADACNIFQVDPFGQGLVTPEAVANKLSILAEHCAAIGRDYDTVLRTFGTGWTILAPDERSLEVKMARYFPDGVEQRYTGTWRHFVSGATTQQAIDHFRALRTAGIQYFIVETLDATDIETITLLANEVAPRV
jgi:alkanesulfonate monooxygenase SsuD/methylene tetrahydromethanopterin reductase-like flavin-dependent oxidoreductase (luciferase family)